MIISKDLFIFGEQIFATIIPESASALGAQPQQQQQQQQQLQQQQPAIINNTPSSIQPSLPLPLPQQPLQTTATTTTATAALINTTASTVVKSPAGAAEQVVDLLKAKTGAGAGTNTGTCTDAVTYTTQQNKQQQQQQQQQQQETVAVTAAATATATATTNAALVVGTKINVQKIPKEGEELKIQKRKQQQQQKCEIYTRAHSTYFKNPMNLLEESADEVSAEQEPLVKRNVAKIIAPTTTATTTTTTKTGTQIQIPTTVGQINYTEQQRSAATLAAAAAATSATMPSSASPIDCRLLLESERPGQTLTVNVNMDNSTLPTTTTAATATNTYSSSSSTTPSSSPSSSSALGTASSSSTSQTTIPSSENLCTNMDKSILLVGKSAAIQHHHDHDHATTVTFPFITDQQQQHQQQQQLQQPTLQLTFQGINVLHNERKILTDVSGLVSPGEVLAIMGPSGSGKTTLLDCLSGQRRIDSGSIYLNREPLTKKWRRRIGYVLQEEIFFTQLTLRETVMYTALLRLPETMPKSEKIHLVDRILETLELSFCQQTKIGDYLNRGLSGGEKKRANIACELLTNPLLMLLDEPTSGLDSHSAISLMKVLKRYAFQEQKTIVITVHQPSSQMFHMFDKLLLLHNGRTAYFGDVNNIYKHFEGIGVTIKPHYNPADFVLEQLKSYPDIREKLFNAAKESHGNIFNRSCNTVQANNQHNSKHHNGQLNGDYANGKQQQQAQQLDKAQTQSNILINDMINNYYKEIQHNQHNHRSHHSHHKHLKHADTMLSAAGGVGHCDEEAAQHLVWCGADSQSNFSSSGSSDCQSYRDDCIGAKANNMEWLDYPTRFHTQFHVLSSRNFKEATPRMLSKLNWFQTIGLALMAGAIWFQIPRTEEFLHDLQGWMFFSQTYWMLFALFGALNSFPSEREVISKERRAGAYRLSAYYLAKMFGELPLVITLPTVYLMISYPMLGCSSLKLFFLMLIFLLLNTMVAQSVGFFIGACCMDMNVSITLSALYTLATQLFGGYLSSRIPEALNWIRYTSMIHYAYQNMQILEFREGPAIKCGVPSSYEICKSNATTFIPYEEILEAQNSNPLWLNTFVLMVFFLVFRGLGYLVLRYVRCPKT